MTPSPGPVFHPWILILGLDLGLGMAENTENDGKRRKDGSDTARLPFEKTMILAVCPEKCLKAVNVSFIWELSRTSGARPALCASTKPHILTFNLILVKVAPLRAHLASFSLKNGEKADPM